MKNLKFYHRILIGGLVFTLTGCGSTTPTYTEPQEKVTEQENVESVESESQDLNTVANEEPTDETQLLDIPAMVDDEEQVIAALEDTNNRIDQVLDNVKDSETLKVIIASVKHGFVHISKLLVNGNFTEAGKEKIMNLMTSIDQKLTNKINNYPEMKEKAKTELSEIKESLSQAADNVFGEENVDYLQEKYGETKEKAKKYYNSSKERFKNWLDEHDDE